MTERDPISTPALPGGLPFDASQIQFTQSGANAVARSVQDKLREIITSGDYSGLTENTFVGTSAGNVTLTGVQNSSLGFGALTSVTTGRQNTAAGYFALNANQTGSFNTAVGSGALIGLVSGDRNVALGYDPLILLAAGSFNIGIGTGSLANFTGGNNNLAIGISALGTVVNQGNNVAIGNSAGAVTTGASSVFLGYFAGAYETTARSFYVNNVDQGSLANDKAFSLLYGQFSSSGAGSVSGQQLTINGVLNVRTSIAQTAAGGSISTTGPLTSSGANGANTASTTKLSMESATVAQLAAWGSGVGTAASLNIVLKSSDASIQTTHTLTTAGISVGGYIEGTEQTAPAAGAVNTGRMFFQDNGAGKTQLMVIFNTGAAQQIAIQP